MAKQKKRTGATKSKHRKTKSLAKKQARASGSKPTKKSAAKSAKRGTKTLAKKVTRGSATRKTRPRKQKQLSAPAPQVETAIVDVVQEPIPGIVTVTEIESVRVTVPDSAEETKIGNLPPEGMAA
jgi:hypothetical protein